MNLLSTINRDGSKTWYLNIPEEVEAPKPSLLSELIKKVSQKFLSFRVRKTNKTNKHRCVKRLRF